MDMLPPLSTKLGAGETMRRWNVCLGVAMLWAAGAMAQVTVSSPVSGATVSSPVELLASANSANPITAMWVYVDEKPAYKSATNHLDLQLPLAAGTHYLQVNAWDSTGAVFVKKLSVRVTAEAAAGDEFTIVALPDTQFYSKSYPQIFRAQTQWIRDNKAAQNIQLVIGLGDIVDGGGEPAQWKNADAAVDLLDGVTPYMMTIGNHDYDHNDPWNRPGVSHYFNTYFGPQRYAGYPWYRGNYPAGSNENFYSVFSFSGRAYLVMSLEFNPRQAALDWASGIIAANPDKEVLLATHSYEFLDDTRVGRCDRNGKYDFRLAADNDGEDMWNKLVRKHANISLVLSGHIAALPGTGHRTDRGDNGNVVNQMLSDYQSEALGGGGYLRILRFKPATNQIVVTTYSPYLDSYKTDARNQFTVAWHADGAMETGSGVVEGKVRNISTCAPVTAASVSYGAGTVTVDGNGHYSITTAAPQSVPLAVSSPGYLKRSATVLVPEGSSGNNDFYLATAGKITGRVTNAAGAGMAGVTVNVQGGVITTSVTVKSDVNGYFSSGWIPIGTYTVSAGGTQKTATATTGATTTADLSLP